MSSRKTSTGTSTTQRRQNLLKSVTEHGRRNMTSGLFRLGPQTLTEVGMETGRSGRGNYFIVRDELRKILVESEDAANPLAINTYRNGRAGFTGFYVRLLPNNGLSIGCKVFKGKAATALREWALYTTK